MKLSPKEELSSSLMELLKNRSFDEITVGKPDANMSNSTFGTRRQSYI